MRSRPTIRPVQSVPHLCSPPPCFPASPLRNIKINRDINLIESPLSYSKQRTDPQFNRNISGTCSPEFSYSLSHFAFLIETPSRIESGPNSLQTKEKTFSNRNKKHSLVGEFFSSHSSHATSHFFSNFARRVPPVYANFPIRPREWSFSVGIPCFWEPLACGQSRGRNFREGSLTRGRP
jgi:hypothetical protein